MAPKENKLHKSVQNLEGALSQYRAHSTDLNFLTLAKAFETAVEYAWREMKRMVEDQGLEAPAPKMAVKEAARLRLITKPEVWLECIDARNNSVHDYFGISKKEYVELAQELVALIKSSKILAT